LVFLKELSKTMRKNVERSGKTVCIASSTKTKIQKAVKEDVDIRIKKGDLVSAENLNKTFETFNLLPSCEEKEEEPMLKLPTLIKKKTGKEEPDFSCVKESELDDAEIKLRAVRDELVALGKKDEASLLDEDINNLDYIPVCDE
jgi:hypothetical protein